MLKNNMDLVLMVVGLFFAWFANRLIHAYYFASITDKDFFSLIVLLMFIGAVLVIRCAKIGWNDSDRKVES